MTDAGNSSIIANQEAAACIIFASYFHMNQLQYYGGTTQSGAGFLVRDLRTSGYQGIIMAPDGVPPARLKGEAADWHDAYKARYGADPEAYALYACVAAEMLLDAFERVCGGGVPSDRKAVRDAVFATKDFSSIIGEFSIDENGGTTITTMSDSQIKNGKFEFVTLLGGG